MNEDLVTIYCYLFEDNNYKFSTEPPSQGDIENLENGCLDIISIHVRKDGTTTTYNYATELFEKLCNGE